MRLAPSGGSVRERPPVLRGAGKPDDRAPGRERTLDQLRAAGFIDLETRTATDPLGSSTEFVFATLDPDRAADATGTETNVTETDATESETNATETETDDP